MFNPSKFAAALAALTLSYSLSASDTIQNDSVTAPSQDKPQSGWFYGAVVSASTSPYREMDNETKALPIIGYRDDKLSWAGPTLSYQFVNQNNFKAKAVLEYYMVGYEDRDSDFFAGMDRRLDSLFGGFSSSYTHEKWNVELSSLHDIQGRSKGNDSKLGLSYAHNIGPTLITPKIALTHLSSAYTDYYYGVSATESAADRAAYEAKASLNKSAGVSVGTPIFLGGYTLFNVSHHWLDDSISDSPLTDEDSIWQATLMYSRFF